MANSDQPVWLKVMEHGAAGEARTKAFLLDRFWVLERSVDIDGADFLIQPRSLSDKFTDRAPPKVGVVQAKYYQDRKTTHYIPCEYVKDKDGKPLRGFFAILHVGSEDAAEMFLLSAQDITSALEQTDDDKPRYILGKKALDQQYLIRSRKQALDRISQDIATRPSLASFQFMDQVNVPYRQISESNIDYRYTLPLPNSQADIPKTYLEYREKLRSLLYEMEEALVAIDTILQTPDPRIAVAELEKLDQFRGGSGHRDQLCFGGYRSDMDWSYFREALDEHDKQEAALRAEGMFEAFVTLSDQIRTQIEVDAKPLEALAKEGQTLWAGLQHDPKTLHLGSLTLRLLEPYEEAPSAPLTARNTLRVVGRQKLQVLRSADTLWHTLMTTVLHQVCPTLKDEED